MDPLISFACPSCERKLKAPAAKAGKRARCKCGAEVVIPRNDPLALSEGPAEADGGPVPLSLDRPPPPAPAPAPAPAAAADDDDEGEGTYTLTESFDKPAEDQPKTRWREAGEDEDEGDEEDEAREKVKEEDEEASRQRRKRLAGARKAPVEEAPWRKVQQGLLFLGIGVGLWTGALALHRLFVGLGTQAPMEYAALAEDRLVMPNEAPVAGQSRTLDRPSFVLGLIGGSRLLTVGKWLVGTSLVLMLAQLIVVAIGGLLCLGGPREFGMRGLSLGTMVLAGFNFLLLFFFQFLPVTGLIRYTIIPYLAPEVAMLEANTERLDPIHITWSGIPLMDTFFGLVFQIALLIEPVLLAAYLRAVAKALKVESLQRTSEGMVRMALGTAFAWLAYLLLMNAGTSQVLMLVLRAVYLFVTCFLFGELLWTTMVLLRSRTGIEKVLKVGWVG